MGDAWPRDCRVVRQRKVAEAGSPARYRLPRPSPLEFVARSTLTRPDDRLQGGAYRRLYRACWVRL